MTKDQYFSIQPGQIMKLNLQLHGLEGYSFGFVESVDSYFGFPDICVHMFIQRFDRPELINRWNLEYWEIAK